MIGKLGVPELLILALIALLIFGSSKLGDLGRAVGDGIRGFKSAVRDEENRDSHRSVAES
jgi:sec-independent protein translocase protein TatA